MSETTQVFLAELNIIHRKIDANTDRIAEIEREKTLRQVSQTWRPTVDEATEKWAAAMRHSDKAGCSAAAKEIEQALDEQESFEPTPTHDHAWRDQTCGSCVFYKNASRINASAEGCYYNNVSAYRKSTTDACSKWERL